jgi:hypothetical protein
MGLFTKAPKRYSDPWRKILSGAGRFGVINEYRFSRALQKATIGSSLGIAGGGVGSHASFGGSTLSDRIIFWSVALSW